MKKIALTLALFLPAILTFSQSKDSEGHTLVSLWKSYEKARDADRPQDQIKILESIKTEARTKRLAWDFYDASEQYVYVRSSINWKDRSECRQKMNEEIEAFGEPVLVLYYNSSSWTNARRSEYIEAHKNELKKANNPEFYSHDNRVAGMVYSKALLPRLKNDYEYAIWTVHKSYDSEVLSDYYSGKYPEEAFIEYTAITKESSGSVRDEMESFISRYKSKAVSLLARQYCLRADFRTLRNDKNSTSAQFKNLREQCTAFERDRKKFSGDEKLIADCCTEVSDLAKQLDEKTIDANVKDGELSVYLRNLKSVMLLVRGGDKILHEASLSNKTDSYYVRDTVRYTLPDLGDGVYELVLKSGDAEHHCEWNRNSLSIALRAAADGYGVFVADYISGEPVASCGLELLDADGKRLGSASGVKISGFTALPEAIRSIWAAKRGQYYLRASLTDSGGRYRCSGKVSLSSPNPASVKTGENAMISRGLILTDRAAFNPGETVHFKGICYSGTYEYVLCPAGEKVKVQLYDAENNLLESKELKTNEFGSVEGEFTLKGGSKGGLWSIRLERGDSTIDSRQIRVDEFVLPTFSVIWDDNKQMYLGGDRVTLSGRVVAYSGHSLGKAEATYKVSQYNRAVVSGDLDLAPDGRFSISFDTPRNTYGQYYSVSVTVIDATGETLEFSNGVSVRGSITFSVSLLNNVNGRYTTTDGKSGGSRGWIVSDDQAQLRFETGGLDREGLIIDWQVFSDKTGKLVRSGKAAPGETVNVDIAKLSSGLYRLEAVASAFRANGEKAESKQTYSFVKASDDDTALDMDVACFFKELGGDDVALQIGSTDGPVWAVVELYGTGNKLLEHQIVTLRGVRGQDGSLKTIRYSRRADWPESLVLKVLWFRKGQVYQYSRNFTLPVETLTLPLEFTRFRDSARPGETFSLLIKTLPGVECAASVFDKATETVRSNAWYAVTPSRRPMPSIYYATECGCNSSSGLYYMMDEGIPFLRAEKNVAASVELMSENAVAETAGDAAPEDVAEIAVRENFDATMAWEPCLRSDADGNIELKLKGADRLSTYFVQLFAHGKGMHNAVLRKEMVVTVPVKVSIVEPQFLYEGDLYTARVTLSSNMEETVGGRVAIRFYDGKDYRNARVIGTKMANVNIAAGATSTFYATFEVPSGVEELGVLVNFVADGEGNASDAMFVSIPVKKPMQTLTEAHSALLRSGADKEALVSELRSLFVNLDPSGLEPQERSIIDMVREAIPDKIEPRSTNVLSLTEAYYANVLARRLGAVGLGDSAMSDMLSKIASCQNGSGGISWFEGMESSPVITANILQRIAAMPEADCSAIDTEAAVKYLDSVYFENPDRPSWCGGISLDLYLQTRALYAGVPFEMKNSKALRQFKKDVKAYLVPTGKRGLNANILAKARRLRTLQLLLQSAEGKALAKSWGISLRNSIVKSYNADVESLLQYAVEHVSGGYYYPNAVMPWRGLMESELYAHSLLCDLLDSVSGGVNGKVPAYAGDARTVAEGIRLWLMVQKETQQWSNDSAYIEALASVLRGTPETLDTRVVLLIGTFTKPFTLVKAAGNGFTVERKFIRNGEVLHEGDMLNVGDKITARYAVWSEENRSFVRLTAPRPASFRPVEQLSGYYGWWLKPLTIGAWSFSPQGYRNVLADKTEYWFDSYPEEKTAITEEFFVTQEGVFQTPAVEIESLYAPHYRANDAGCGPLESK